MCLDGCCEWTRSSRYPVGKTPGFDWGGAAACQAKKQRGVKSSILLFLHATGSTQCVICHSDSTVLSIANHSISHE